MNVYIDIPEIRALTPNERKVYDLLEKGFTDVEIAKKIHMRLQNDPHMIYNDVPPDTVRGLMTSMREKGWKIPQNIKEENNMPKGSKTPDEKIAEINALRSEGKPFAKIAEETGVPQTTVQRICRKLTEEKEPAPAATDTSSEFETCENVSTDSITKNAENVKRKIPQAIIDALDEERIRLQGFIDEDSKHISSCQSKINDIENFVKKFGGTEND